ncbi:MAG: fibronectin type III-like domain-contianing protein, partial [Bacteroidales bacterium]|nr:fibronectin type III-like domain-contianing protein [Bacteroidales bacterium]
GRLCVSYPSTEDTDLRCYNEQPDSTRIAWPFGYGLSYTSFAFDDFRLDAEATTNGGPVTVSCRVTNTGDFDGAEVVQLYVSPASGQPLKPLQLKGFQRVELERGASATVSFAVDPDQLAWWSADARGRSVWTVSPGDYRFRIGSSSADLPLEGVCHLDGAPQHKQLRDAYFPEITVTQ